MIFELAVALAVILCLVLVLPAVFGIRLVRSARSARSAAPTHCGNCKHFDLEEGQAVMRQHKPFLAAAAVLAPAEMGKTIQYEELECSEEGCGKAHPIQDCLVCRGNGTVNKRIGPAPTGVAAKVKWADFGACLENNDIRHSSDSCSAFEPREEPPA